MRRTINLQNVLYRKKYKEIYKLVFNADLDEVKDRSTWMYHNKDYNSNEPLWIIIESKILNKRMWVSDSFHRLEITTAQLDLDCKSSAYHESHKYYSFNTQSELCEKLKEILEPCLTEYNKEQSLEKEQDLEYEKD